MTSDEAMKVPVKSHEVLPDEAMLTASGETQETSDTASRLINELFVLFYLNGWKRSGFIAEAGNIIGRTPHPDPSDCSALQDLTDQLAEKLDQ